MAIPAPQPGSAALVTGASSGIGVELARQLAERGHDLVLVARRRERLEALAEEIREQQGRRVEIVAADVSDPEARGSLIEQVGALGLEVDVLILCAGFGMGGPFTSQDPDRIQLMIRTNLEGVVMLAREYAPQMEQRGRGAILVVSSYAGNQPMPNFGAYAATKAGATSFAEMLHEELRHSGVTVTALCPGGVRTEFAGVAEMTAQADRVPSALMTDPARCAREAISGMERGKRKVVPTLTIKALSSMGRHLPRGLILRASPKGDGMTELAPVMDDLSIYLICGRVTTETRPGFTHVSSVLTDAEDAERLGFRRGWLSERFDLKHSGAILGGCAARTTRFGVGTGVWATPSRHPMVAASYGATMNALYGPRFILGLGRGVPLPDMPEHSYEQFVDYAETVSALWEGGTVDYNGTELRTVDALGEVPKPEIWACGYGRPKFAKAAANDVFDGVMLYPFLTAEAVREAVERIRNACADRGRDPESIHICHPIVVAAELDDLKVRAYAHARAVTYLEWPGHGEALTGSNAWDQSVLTKLREHKQLAGKNADQDFHRAELLEPAELVPDEWMEESCAIGSVEHCVERLEAYRAAGADEIAIYASTPLENEALAQAWWARTYAPT